MAVGGRLISPVLDAAKGQRLLVIDRLDSGVFQRTEYEAVQFVPLKSGSI
jgi:protein-L-isoaspartate O-methyltransferase